MGIKQVRQDIYNFEPDENKLERVQKVERREESSEEHWEGKLGKHKSIKDKEQKKPWMIFIVYKVIFN